MKTKTEKEIYEIQTELQILEYIQYNKGPLTKWERQRQAELEALLKKGGPE